MPFPPSPFRRSAGLPSGLFGTHCDPDGRLYLLPAGIIGGEAAAAAVIAGSGWPLAGTDMAFTASAVIWRDGVAAWIATVPFPDLVLWSDGEDPLVARHVGRLVNRIGARRKPWAGLELDRPLVMGIVNATPDSFSDGGDTLAADTAVARGLALVEAGADIVDVGGESTRPGSAPVSEDEELARVLPVVRALAERDIVVSIDTRHARVMAESVAAGARIINDVAALREPGAMATAAGSGAAVCVMHMQGEPRTMQDDPYYDCAPLDVYDFLAERMAACIAVGVAADRIAIDPGIGFGKSTAHNTQVLAALGLYHGLGAAVLLGASRKRFVAALSADEPPKQRLPGSLAAALAGLASGVQIIRVHDVAETVQAVKVWQAIHAVS